MTKQKQSGLFMVHRIVEMPNKHNGDLANMNKNKQ